MGHTTDVLAAVFAKKCQKLTLVTLLGVAGGVSCRSNEATVEGGATAGYEYIVVGSGAGGGPLAARLARAGKRVLLLEAGEDVGGELRYQVPAMHALATEDARMAWWFFVQHSADEAIDRTDSKHTPEGILYPRGSALGGSTAVNAMVTVLPSRSDWNRIAEITGDRTWRADAMNAQYDRVREWLGIELPDAGLALSDRKISSFLSAAAIAGTHDVAAASNLSTVLSHDLNAALRDGETTGLYRLPLATKSGKRNGARERVLDTVAAGFPLTVMTGAFVTRVMFDESAPVPTVRGVEYVKQSGVYAASLERHDVTAATEIAVASSEVILSAGTFNTPQLLMLSGIGDPTELEAVGIASRVALPAVGKNLQDRYEAAVVSELAAPIDLLEACKLGAEPDVADPCLDQWKEGRGAYETPGFLAALLVRSRPTEPLADLAIFAVPADARGYYPGYASDSAKAKDRFTWLLLKAHAKNADGRVRLASASAFDRPKILFASYDERDPAHDPDLLALVEGVRTVRRIASEMRTLVREDPVREIWPGPEKQSDAELGAWIRKESWGHHACCTSKMGRADDPSAVVGGDFRVHGVAGLRVVDSSVFPEIPGTFIALPTYMIAEKAADAILGGGSR